MDLSVGVILMALMALLSPAWLALLRRMEKATSDEEATEDSKPSSSVCIVSDGGDLFVLEVTEDAGTDVRLNVIGRLTLPTHLSEAAVLIA